METDSVDYPELLSMPCISTTNNSGPNTNNVNGKGRKHSFLQRSDSTLCLGCPLLDPFDTSLSEALPLADQPHLLQPHSRREDLFGVPRHGSSNSSSGLEGLPTKLGLSTRNNETQSINSSTLILGHTPEQIAKSHGGSSSNVERKSTQESHCSVSIEQPVVPVKFNEKLKIYSQSTEQSSQPVTPLVDQQTDRAPIIVSPTNQILETDGNNSSSPQKSCTNKIERSVIVRAGSSNSSACPIEPQNNIDKQSFYATSDEVIVAEHNVESEAVVANEEVDLTNKTLNQETSAYNASIETNPVAPTLSRQQVSSLGNKISHNILLGRWRLSLDLFGRVFMEDVGLEAGSIVSELGGFPVKEAKFRRDMEKLRSSQQKDITLSKVERDRTQLLIQTMKELNTQYNIYNRRASNTPPLAVSRVKVTFKDEPGEGSGVARSFYTAIAEALLANEKLPNLEAAQVGSKYAQYNVLQKLKIKDRDRDFRRQV